MEKDSWQLTVGSRQKKEGRRQGTESELRISKLWHCDLHDFLLDMSFQLRADLTISTVSTIYSLPLTLYRSLLLRDLSIELIFCVSEEIDFRIMD
jgi:hypothetical protein